MSTLHRCKRFSVCIFGSLLAFQIQLEMWALWTRQHLTMPYWWEFFLFTKSSIPLATECLLNFFIRQMANLCYFYMILKASYALESVLAELTHHFVLKSNYMLYHHFMQTVMVWIVANFYPGGHFALMMFLNCFVHVFIDGYYLIFVLLFPALKPKFQFLKQSILWLVVS